jgi:hypothetical protein
MDDFASAVRLLKSGDRLTAQKTFESLLKTDPDNELLWQWLARAVDNPEEKRECLLEVLRINPGNISAKIEIELLGNSTIDNKPKDLPKQLFTSPDYEEPPHNKNQKTPPPLPAIPSISYEPGEKESNSGHFCSNCGEKVEGRFCSNCGSPTQKNSDVNFTPIIFPQLNLNKTENNDQIKNEIFLNSTSGGKIGYEPIIVQVPATPPNRFTTKRTISAIGLGLIIIAGLLSWENTQEWYGLLLGGYHSSSSIGLSTGPGILSTLSGIIALILLFAVQKESRAHFFAILFSAISGIAAGIFMASTGGSVWNRFGIAESISSAGVGIFVVYIGAAISIGSLIIPSNKKQA